MSTTEQSDTTIQTQIINLFENFIKRSNSPIKEYKWNGAPDIDTTFIIMVQLKEPYNAVETAPFYKLSKNGRLGIKRQYDAFHEIECPVEPGEKIKKVTLFLALAVPKSEALRKEYFSKETLTEEQTWMYNEKQIQIVYIPIRTIYDVRGPITFYDHPIPLYLLPYSQLSIHVEYERKQMDYHGVRLTQYLYATKLREGLFSDKSKNIKFTNADLIEKIRKLPNMIDYVEYLI